MDPVHLHLPNLVIVNLAQEVAERHADIRSGGPRLRPRQRDPWPEQPHGKHHDAQLEQKGTDLLGGDDRLPLPSGALPPAALPLILSAR